MAHWNPKKKRVVIELTDNNVTLLICIHRIEFLNVIINFNYLLTIIIMIILIMTEIK